ncbi:hypothetical protein L0337_43190 [candidate division KSB1 bacterium]|nr:hypothetical protein [candidate division KSB1 bacterium]
MKRLMGVFFVLILLPSLVSAQSLKIEALRPQFEFAGAEPTFWTSAWFVTVAVPIHKRLHFVGQLPFAFGKLKDATVPTEGEAIGNPGLGLRFDHERLTIDLGARIPVVQKRLITNNGFGSFIGALADIDRQEAFVPDILPIFAMIRTKINASKISIHPYGGASLTVKLQNERNDFFARIFRLREDDGELYVLYGADGWLELKPVYLGATFSGRTWVSSGGTFSDSSIHQISVRAKLVFEKVTPGLLFRFPLDDILLDNVFGLNFEINL